MSAVQQLIYYGIIILVVFMVGYPVVLSLKKEHEKNWIVDTFGVGTAILICISFWSSYLGNGFQKASPVILLLIILVFAVSCFKYRKKCFILVKIVGRANLLGILVCVLTGLLPMMIYFIYHAIYPYCDGFTYLCNADYLLSHGYRDSINTQSLANSPWLSQTYLYQQNGFRIGVQMLLSFFTGLFGADMSVKAYLPILGFGVFLCGVAALGFGRETNKFSDSERLFSAVFTAFNGTIIIWLAEYGFVPQLYGSGLIILGISRFISIRKWEDDKYWYLLSEMLFIGALAYVYNEMLPFFALLAGAYLILILCKDKKRFSKAVLNSIICAGGVIIIILPYFGGMIKAILAMLSATVGWNQEKGILTYILYYFSTIAPDSTIGGIRLTGNSNSLLVTIVFSVMAVGAFLVGLYSRVIKDKEKGNLIEMIILLSPYILMFIYYSFVVDNPFGDGRGNSWSVFKTIQYAFVVAAPYIAYYLLHGLQKLNKILIVIYSIFFVLFNIYNSYLYQGALAQNMIRLTGNLQNPMEEYFKLQNKYKNSNEKIFLSDNIDIKHRQMITYFLKSNTLVSDWSTDGYFADIPLEQEKKPVDICLVYEEADDSIANVVERSYTVDFGNGVYNLEMNEEDEWRWCQKQATLLVNNISGFDDLVTFAMDIWPTNSSENEIIIKDENGVIFEGKLSAESMTHIEIPIVLQKSVLELELLFEGAIDSGNPLDNRELAYRISNCEVY